MKEKKTSVELDLVVTDKLQSEGYAREVIRHVQNHRKKAGLNVEDRIILSLNSSDKNLSEAINEHKDLIAKEVLAVELTSDLDGDYSTEVQVDKKDLKLTISKK